MSTRRERIIDILKKSGRPLTINEIAYELGLDDPKEIKHLYCTRIPLVAEEK